MICKKCGEKNILVTEIGNHHCKGELHYSARLAEVSQELTDLKVLVRELIEQWDYSKDVGLQDYIDKLKQACTLANGNSKEEDK